MLPAAILQSPQALDAKAFQARCAEFSKAKDWTGLEQAARAQIQASPADAAAYSALGYALFAQDRRDEGKAACEAALKNDPKHWLALFYLGMESASEGDSTGVKAAGKRLEGIGFDEVLRFWSIPSVQQAVIPDASIPWVDGAEIHFKNMSIQPVLEITGPLITPMVIAFTVDAEGTPVRAEMLLAPPGPAGHALEAAAMRWRMEPAKIHGRASAVRFVKIIPIETTVTTETVKVVPRR